MSTLRAPEAVIARHRKIRAVIDAFLPARLQELSAYAGAIFPPPRDLLFGDLRAIENGGAVYKDMPALSIAPASSVVTQDGASTQTLVQTLDVMTLLSHDYPVSWSTALTEAYVNAVIEVLCAHLVDPVGGAPCVGGCTGIFAVRQTSSAQGGPVRLGDQDFMISARGSLEIQQRQRYAFGASTFGQPTSPHHYDAVVSLEYATLDWGGVTVQLNSRAQGIVELTPPAGVVAIQIHAGISGTLTARAQPSSAAVTATITDGAATIDLSALAVPGALLTLTALDATLGAAHTYVVRVVAAP